MAPTRTDRDRSKYNWFSLLWFTVPLLVYAGLWLGRPEVLRMEWLSLDWRFSTRGPLEEATNVVVIAIDDASLDVAQLVDASVIQTNRGLDLMRSPHPWPREVHGILIDRLLSGGAKAVALDLLFISPSSHGEADDASFEDALSKHGSNVVLAANLVNYNAQGELGSSAQIFEPIDRFKGKTRSGLVNYLPDGDRVIRRVAYELSLEAVANAFVSENQKTYRPSFPLQILRAAGFDRPEVPQGGLTLIPYLGPGQGTSTGVVPVYPYHFVIDDKGWAQVFRNGEVLKDKIVLVGPTASHFQDKHLTPFGEMKGVEIHAQVVAAAIRGLMLTELPPWSWLPLLLLCSALAYTVPRVPHNALLRFITLLAVMAAYVVFAQWLFSAHSMVILLAMPLATMALVGVGSQAQDFWIEQRERARLRRTFETHVSKNIADALLSDRHRLQSMLGGERRPVTILFSDVRSFTAMSENAPPEAIVAQLNEYLSGMVDCVLQESGTLHKFIGDAVMAVWGDTMSGGREADARRAVRAGLAMFRRLSELNARWAAEGRTAIRMGIGINHGEVIVGNIGSTKRMEFTVIGDPVNLASRLEGATKEFGADILIGEEARPLLGDEFLLRPAGRIQVKGRSRAVNVYEVVGESDGPSPRIDPESIAVYEKAIAAFYGRDFAAAAGHFSDFLGRHPDDPMGRSYLEESRRLLDQPPPPDWDGTHVMHTK